MHRYIWTILLTFFMWTSALVAQTLQEVEVTGYGTTHELAMKDAMRNAAEQTVGIVIGSETLVQNFALVSDKILSKSLGYVSS